MRFLILNILLVYNICGHVFQSKMGRQVQDFKIEYFIKVECNYVIFQ